MQNLENKNTKKCFMFRSFCRNFSFFSFKKEKKDLKNLYFFNRNITHVVIELESVVFGSFILLSSLNDFLKLNTYNLSLFLNPKMFLGLFFLFFSLVSILSKREKFYYIINLILVIAFFIPLVLFWFGKI